MFSSLGDLYPASLLCSAPEKQAHKTLKVVKAEEEILLSLYVSMAIFQVTWVSRYQNVSILDFIGAKDDGGGGWWQLEL